MKGILNEYSKDKAEQESKGQAAQNQWGLKFNLNK
jgi:hypothetical protein